MCTWLYASLGCVPGYMPPWYMHLYTTLVYTPVYHPGYTSLTSVLPVPTLALAHHEATMPWALHGNIPWVEASRDPKVNKGVMRGIALCAELFPLSPTNRMKDWIDGGSFPLYPLSSGNVAQSGPFSSRHPIVCLMSERCPPVRHPFHCWVMKVPVCGAIPGGVERLGSMLRRLLLLRPTPAFRALPGFELRNNTDLTPF